MRHRGSSAEGPLSGDEDRDEAVSGGGITGWLKMRNQSRSNVCAIRSADTHFTLPSRSSRLRIASHHARGLPTVACSAVTLSVAAGHHGTGMPAHVGSRRKERITNDASPV